MKFERARTDQQKNARIDEIITISLGQYNNSGYENVTLSSIARDLSFSRVNLYKYFNSKEEIFLKILSIETRNFTETLIKNIYNEKEITPSTYAKIFAETMYGHKTFLHLSTLELSVIQKNVSYDQLKEHVDLTSDLFGQLTDLLVTLFPKITKNDGAQLIYNIFLYSQGLYAATSKNDIQLNICRQLEFSAMSPKYVPNMTDFILRYLNSLL